MSTRIKIYGSEGCQTFTKLKKDFENEASNLEEDFEVEKVTEMTKLAENSQLEKPSLEMHLPASEEKIGIEELEEVI